MNRQEKSAEHQLAGRHKRKAKQGVPHPLHWLSGFGGLFLGIVTGTVWFFKRCDVSIS